MRDIRLGVTGSRSKPKEQQVTALREWVAQHTDHITEVHHGDCIGWDQTVHRVIASHDEAIAIHIHPPKNPIARAYMQLDTNTHKNIVVHPEKKYLERNDDIVDAIDVLIAAPKSMNRRHSGTWYTIRKAHEANKEIVIFM